MPRNTFESLLPYSGAVAGLCWIGQSALQRTTTRDAPGAATTSVVRDNLATNYASVACLVLMGMSLLIFATAVRNLLRSGEPGEATFSHIAYGGWLVVVAGISQMVTWNWGLINGAAAAADDAALQALSYVHFFGWAGMGRLFITSMDGQEVDPVMFYTILTGGLAMIANLVADFLYAVIDPRIRVNA